MDKAVNTMQDISRTLLDGLQVLVDEEAKRIRGNLGVKARKIYLKGWCRGAVLMVSMIFRTADANQMIGMLWQYVESIQEENGTNGKSVV